MDRSTSAERVWNIPYCQDVILGVLANHPGVTGLVLSKSSYRTALKSYFRDWYLEDYDSLIKNSTSQGRLRLSLQSVKILRVRDPDLFSASLGARYHEIINDLLSMFQNVTRVISHGDVFDIIQDEDLWQPAQIVATIKTSFSCLLYWHDPDEDCIPDQFSNWRLDRNYRFEYNFVDHASNPGFDDYRICRCYSRRRSASSTSSSGSVITSQSPDTVDSDTAALARHRRRRNYDKPDSGFHILRRMVSRVFPFDVDVRRLQIDFPIPIHEVVISLYTMLDTEGREIPEDLVLVPEEDCLQHTLERLGVLVPFGLRRISLDHTRYNVLETPFQQVLQVVDWSKLRGLSSIELWIDPIQEISCPLPPFKETFFGPPLDLQYFTIHLRQTEGPTPCLDIQSAASLLGSYMAKSLRLIGGPACDYQVELVDTESRYRYPLHRHPSNLNRSRYEVDTQVPPLRPPRSEVAIAVHEALRNELRLEFERSLAPVGWARLSRVV